METHIALVALAPHPAIRKRIYVSQSPRRIFRHFPALFRFRGRGSRIQKPAVNGVEPAPVSHDVSIRPKTEDGS